MNNVYNKLNDLEIEFEEFELNEIEVVSLKKLSNIPYYTSGAFAITNINEIVKLAYELDHTVFLGDDVYTN